MLTESHRVLASRPWPRSWILEAPWLRRNRFRPHRLLRVSAGHPWLPQSNRTSPGTAWDDQRRTDNRVAGSQIDVAFCARLWLRLRVLRWNEFRNAGGDFTDDHPLAAAERIDLEMLDTLFAMVPTSWYTTFNPIVRACQWAVSNQRLSTSVFILRTWRVGHGRHDRPHAVTRLRLDGILFKELDGLLDTLMIVDCLAVRVSPATVSLWRHRGHRRENIHACDAAIDLDTLHD